MNLLKLRLFSAVLLGLIVGPIVLKVQAKPAALTAADQTSSNAAPDNQTFVLPWLNGRYWPTTGPADTSSVSVTRLEEIVKKAVLTVRPGSRPTAQVIAQEVAELEAYCTQYPDSPYIPTVRASLASHYEMMGRYSLALTNNALAWDGLKQSDEPLVYNFANRVFADHVLLLSMLGRTEALTELLDETAQRDMGRYAARGRRSQ